MEVLEELFKILDVRSNDVLTSAKLAGFIRRAMEAAKQKEEEKAKSISIDNPKFSEGYF
jgi:hypothetical protein